MMDAASDDIYNGTYALADLTAFLTASLRLFFSSITANLPKSFRLLLVSNAFLLAAQLLFSHFSTVASFSSCFLMTPEPAARGRAVSFKGVRVRCL